MRVQKAHQLADLLAHPCLVVCVHPKPTEGKKRCRGVCVCVCVCACVRACVCVDAQHFIIHVGYLSVGDRPGTHNKGYWKPMLHCLHVQVRKCLPSG